MFSLWLRAVSAPMVVLALVIMFAIPVASHHEIFVDENFTNPDVVLDNVEITASGLRLLVASESWVQATETDFKRGNYEDVVVSDLGVRLAKIDNDRWVAKDNAPYSSAYGIAAVGAGRYVFILRGYYSGVKVGIGRYDTETGSWESWSDPAIEWQEKKHYFKNGCAMAWDNGDYIYVLAGGSYNDVPNPSDPTKYEPRYGFWRFRVDDPSSWTRLENTPWWQGPGDCLTWVKIGDEEYIYAWLGTTSRGCKADPGYAKFYRYHITPNAPDGIGKWEVTPITEIAENGIPEYPYGADDGANLVWTGGDYIYYMPGAYNESLSRDAEFAWGRFVISENRWERLADMPLNVNPETEETDGVDDGGSAVWDGGNFIYVLKGGDGSGSDPAENFYRYSISDDSWEVLANVPAGPHRNNGTRLGYAGKRVYYWHANSSGFWAYEPPCYERDGWFESEVFDAGEIVTWQQASWQVSLPGGVTRVKKSVSAEPTSLVSGEDRLGSLPTNIADHVVISEIYPNAKDETNSEWFELYNPTSSPIDMSGWSFGRITSAGNKHTDGTFPEGTTIPAHGYFLVGDNTLLADNTAWPSPDYVESLTIANSDGCYFVENSDGYVDKVAWGSNTYGEGNPFPTNPGEGKSLERKSSATHDETGGNGYDTDSNTSDFYIRSSPQPQNSSSPTEAPLVQASNYLETWSRDGVFEEIEEGATRVPETSGFHEGGTVVEEGTVSSGSPANLDANDQVYFEVDAAFAEGGARTETLHEAGTTVENGSEVSGTSTANLDADDGVYYEVDAGSSPGGEGSNLIQNPGFETGDLTHWTELGTSGKHVVTNERAASGTYSCKFVDLTTSYSGRRIVANNVAVTPGKDYRFGARFYIPQVGGGSIENYKVRCWIEWYCENGDLAGRYQPWGRVLSAFNAWEAQEWTDTAPEGAAKAAVFVDAKRASGSPQDNVYIDDVKLAEITSVYSIDLRHDSEQVTVDQTSVDNISVKLNFKSSASALYTWQIYDWTNSSWLTLRSGTVGTTEVSWENTITTNPANYISDGAQNIRVRLYTSGESSAHRVQIDLLEYRVNYTSAGTYSLEMRHDSAPVSYEGALEEIRVTVNFKSENTATYHFEIYNFDSGQWEPGQSGLVGASEVTWTITRTSNPANYISPDENIRVRLRTSNESSAHRSQVDYLEFRVLSSLTRYRLRWEHRLTDVEDTLQDCVIKICGYNATGDENVSVSVWNSSTNGWETIGMLPSTPGELTHSLQNISDYLVGNNVSIKFEDENADTSPTRIRIDYVALEAQKPYSTVVRVKVRSSSDNVVWPDWASVPYISPGSPLPYESRYLQYRVELLTEDNTVTPAFDEFTATYAQATKASTGTFTSQPLELGYVESWGTLSWSGDVPENTSISFATRSSVDGSVWSDWQELDSGTIQSPTYGRRYLQVRATFHGVGTATPTLHYYSIAYTPDRTPPVITLSEPSENFVTSSRYITLKGQLEDANPITLEVNGKSISLDPGSFEVCVELSPGHNTIRVTALDAAGNQSEITLSGTYSPPAGWIKWALVAAVVGAVAAVVVLFVTHKGIVSTIRASPS